MAKARIEFGEQKVDENEHEFAIEQFEKAKKLAERASDEKMAKESMKKIDDAYEKMAEFHFDQAEDHKKAGQYEWAIVQYKKAREIYMLTTDKKMRAKSAEKARECYVDWGEDLEDKADHLAKQARTREALATYQEAAEKYKEGGNNKKLRGLEKKIRNA
jgi:tetratricopeptide (TPR) repeat protein